MSAIPRSISPKTWLTILALFTLSGMSGILYEGLWARYLKVLLGHAAYGQILTLCIYMGGLGVGSFWAAKLLRKSNRPMRAYAYTELAIGLGGFIYHFVFTHAMNILFQSGILQGMSILPAVFVKLTLALITTAPSAILLGMTFPFLTSAVIRLQGDHGQQALPRLYFSNSLGAGLGILLLSFLFMPSMGTQGSLWIAALANIFIGLTFLWLSAQLETTSVTVAESSKENAKPTASSQRFVKVLLTIAFFTGFSSFLYEISWIRILALAFGSSTHAFDIMLSAFIIGLAAGAFVARPIMKQHDRELHWLAFAQVGMAMTAALTLFFYSELFDSINHLNKVFQRTSESYLWVGIVKYGISMLFMGPTSFFAGMTLPLLTYSLCRRTGEESHTGKVYGFNTIGSIAGAAFGGLIVLPSLQLAQTISLGAMLDWGIGLAIVLAFGIRHVPLFASIVISGAIVFYSWTISLDYRVLTQGSYRGYAQTVPNEKVTARDGITATVSFHVHPKGSLSIKTNGKADASLNPYPAQPSLDAFTQGSLAWLPMAATHQANYRAAIVGLGSGMTAHHLLADPRLAHLDIIEIEAEMIALARGFLPANSRAYEDPRSKLVVQDARTFFASQKEPYDLIISEPSNPWVSGVSSLFTTEFYSDVKRHMSENAVLAQWFHTYEMSDDVLFSMLAALNQNFKFYDIYTVPSTPMDIIIIASDSPVRLNPSSLNNAMSMEEMKRLQIAPTKLCMMQYVIGKQALQRFLQNRPVNSEWNPVMDNLAEKAYFTQSNATLISSMMFRGFFSWLDVLDPSHGNLNVSWNQSMIQFIDAVRLHPPQDSAAFLKMFENLDKMISPYNWREESIVKEYLSVFDTIFSPNGAAPAIAKDLFQFRRMWKTDPAASDQARIRLIDMNLSHLSQSIQRDLMIASILRKDKARLEQVANYVTPLWLWKFPVELKIVEDAWDSL